MKKHTFTLAFALLMIFSLASTGQPVRKLTVADYDKAVSRLAGNVSRFIDNDIHPAWLPDGRLWFKAMNGDQAQFVLFNPADKKKTVASTRKELFSSIPGMKSPGYY